MGSEMCIRDSLYSDVLDAWLQSTRINIKESTYARYSHLIETHIRPQLGKYPLSKISTQLIEGFIETQLNSGRLDKTGGLSAKTVTDILTIVKSTMEYARYNNLMVSCNLSKLTIKKKDKEMRVLCQCFCLLYIPILRLFFSFSDGIYYSDSLFIQSPCPEVPPTLHKIPPG